MKPGKNVDVKEEIVEVHSSGRSPSPKPKNKDISRSRSGSRKLSNGHVADNDTEEPITASEETEKSKRDSWIKSEHESIDTEIPIHDQIKQDILGFVEKEFKKSDKNPSFVFYSHDPNDLDEKFMKTLSRPSSGHKEKRSPSNKKKKRLSSKHRDRDFQDFEIPGSSLSALEKVDDYLKEYNKDEVVNLSGELEIETSQLDNNDKEMRHKSRKTRRKIRDERQNAEINGKDISPKVFKTGGKSKIAAKTNRPKDLSAMLDNIESNMPYHDQYIDNPFSSPSPLTSPNDDRSQPFGTQRPEKIYMQGGGTFRAVSRDRIMETHNSKDEKYLRLGDLTALDVALALQRAWGSCAMACHGVLGGLSLMHLLVISYSDGLDPSHLSFHAVVTMPYVAAYYFFCIMCLVSVLDRLDITSLDLTRGIQSYFQPIVLVVVYMACLLVCSAARSYDELMVYQYTPLVVNITGNFTVPTTSTFYHTWTHFSIWRAVLSILGLVYFIISNPKDMLYTNLSKLLQFKQSLQSIG